MTQIAKLYEHYGPMVYRRCLDLVKNQDDAADLCQDVFVKLLQQDSLSQEGISSYLWTIATRLSLNFIRNRKSRGANEDQEALLEKIAKLDDLDSKLHAQGILGRLFNRQPENTKEIAVMFFLDGMTHQDIANIVNLSVSGVRKRLAQLRSTLNLMEGT